MRGGRLCAGPWPWCGNFLNWCLAFCLSLFDFALALGFHSHTSGGIHVDLEADVPTDFRLCAECLVDLTPRQLIRLCGLDLVALRYTQRLDRLISE
jgi:hypothetical protein